jgi:hypothetical protein
MLDVIDRTCLSTTLRHYDERGLLTKVEVTPMACALLVNELQSCSQETRRRKQLDGA